MTSQSTSFLRLRVKFSSQISPGNTHMYADGDDDNDNEEEPRQFLLILHLCTPCLPFKFLRLSHSHPNR